MKFLFRMLRNFKVQVVLLVLITSFTALSLFSYTPYDPSWNNYNQYDIQNIMGSYGSVFSDLLLQTFGIGVFFVPLIFMIWLKELIHNRFIRCWVCRIISTLLYLIFSSVAIGLISFDYIAINLGGVISYFLKSHLDSYDILIRLISILLAVIFFLNALGYDFVRIFGLFYRWFVYLKSKYKKNEYYLKEPPKIEHDTISHLKASPHKKAFEENKVQLSKSSIDHLNIIPGEQIVASPTTKGYLLPSVELLDVHSKAKVKLESNEELKIKAENLLKVLNDFGVRGTIFDIHQGPVVTLYEFEPSAGTKSSRVIGLADDIARSISAISTRIAIMPGRNALGIEIPNEHRQFFSLRELIDTQEYNSQNLILPIILGKNLGGKTAVVDLAKMPHLLVAGTTGSGKSVAINAMIISLLYRHTAETCKFIMIDPKMLELSVYQDIPHLLTPVVTESSKAIVALKWAVKEMENRYRLMSNLNVRNITGYNDRIGEAVLKKETLVRTMQTGFDMETGKPIYESVPLDMKPLPFIVIIVDEMADLMLVAGKDIETSIQRLAQMARAAGIHLIMATQRPSVDVITGVIKANFPSRVSFKVTSKIDSRTILGEQGAEQLLGMGDMLYVSSTSSVSRLHGPFVDDKEVERIAKFLKSQGVPDYISAVTESTDENVDGIVSDDDQSDDSLYNQAVSIVKRDRKVSTSYIQRCLRIGYNRAAILVERMEKAGIVSEPSSTGKREILLPE
jgi:S-DNA-T family DNA segregation ATPase FtsK/SpoIIIE